MKTITEKQKNLYLVETRKRIKELNGKINLLILMGEDDCNEFNLFNTQREQLKKIEKYLVEQN